MHVHTRIRILLVAAVVAICTGLLALGVLQSRADTVAFEEYAAVTELGTAGDRLALAVNEAGSHGGEAAGDVEEAKAGFADALAAVRARPDGLEAAENALVDAQASAGQGLSDVADAALTRGLTPALEERRDALLRTYTEANDDLLAELAAERASARRRAEWLPVILILAFVAVFGVLATLLIERPARRERRGRRAQREFWEATQVARGEDEAYAVLSRHVARAADARRVTVLNRNNSADRLEPATPVEPGSPVAGALAGAKPDSCLAIRLARTRQAAAGEDGLLACEVCAGSPGRTTCVPSLVGGEVVGAVLVEHTRRLDPETRRLVEQSVAEAAPVIANLRNLAVAEIRAATDSLTGMPNQRAVHETLKRAAALASRSATPLALVLFDLDHFKTVNDTYGHGKGDEVLASVGAVTVETLRASDFAGRLGGEEFAVILPETDRGGAMEVAEKLRAAVATISVPGVALPVTASFGVAVLPDDAGEPERLLREADRALYSAKNAGRNRVETVAGSPAEATRR